MGRADFHWPGGRRVKVNSRAPFRGLTRPHLRPRSPFTLEAVGDRPAFQPPLAEEGLAPALDLRGRFSVDHVAVILGQFIVQPLRRMREKIAVLVNRAALDGRVGPEPGQRRLQPGCAVARDARRWRDDDEAGRTQTARARVLGERSPGGGRLAAHVLQPDQYLMTVAAHADRHEDRDRRGLPVDPRLDHGTIKGELDDVLAAEIAGGPCLPVALHLAPGAADGHPCPRPRQTASKEPTSRDGCWPRRDRRPRSAPRLSGSAAGNAATPARAIRATGHPHPRSGPGARGPSRVRRCRSASVSNRWRPDASLSRSLCPFRYPFAPALLRS